MKPIRIIIADDHRIIRDGLRMVLSQNQQFEIIKEVSNGVELLKGLDLEACDVVLLDISMPELNGLESLRLIKLNYPTLKVLIITMHDEPDYVLKAIQNGADGYILKNSDHQEIIKAIETLYEGKKYYNSTVSNIMVESLNKKPIFEMEPIHLTNREKEILKLVANGLSNKLIADELNISSRTVETHRTNLLRKFDVYNTAELVKKASELDLL